MVKVQTLMGDCLERMKALPDASIDSIVTDPPYELGFMGKAWDASGIACNVEMWREALRVLKPGGHLLAFSGSRTYHRMTCAIEDAGFDIRDQIMWVYGSGFPKSQNISKAIDKQAGAEREVVSEGKAVKRMIPGADQNDTGSWIKDNGREYVPQVTRAATPEAEQWEGWGTALKPAHEPICVARKPLVGTVAANVLAHGTGALNIDACRVDGQGGVKWESPRGGIWATDSNATAKLVQNEQGRWPANLIHDGSDEVLAAFPDAKGQQGATAVRSQGEVYGTVSAGQTGIEPRNDAGNSAARFFYCAKASKSDRGSGNTHPTVKPQALMRHLIRMVTPPGGTTLDMFMGSGSTGIACISEGCNFIGIEKDSDYFFSADARIWTAWGMSHAA